MSKTWLEFGKEVNAACKEKLLCDINTDEEWIRFALNFILKHNAFLIEEGDIKDADISENYRQEGNKLYYSINSPVSKDNCVEILKLYNTSIAFAPRRSLQLALAYANRSTILYELEKYELCIKDINRALAQSCTDYVRLQLCTRMVECMKALKHPGVKDFIDDVPSSLKQLCVDDSLRMELIQQLDSPETARNSRKRDNLKKLQNLHITDPNPEAPCATNAVKIEYNKEYGRHLVATRDIERGEIVIVEEPYSLVLIFEQIYFFCSNCFEMSWALIPCDYCTCAMYCSEECKTTSWKKYHDIECAILPILSKAKSNLTDVLSCSIRLVIQAVREFASIEDLRKEVSDVDNCNDPRTKGFSKNGILASDKYRSVLGLLTNTNKRTRQQLFLMSIDSSFILYHLAVLTNLFGKPLKKDLSAIANNDDAVFIGSLIFRHQQLICTNYHIFCENSELGKMDQCALGVLPFASLINHSCDPNTFKSCKFKRSIRHAKRVIEKGEQLFDSYCPPYDVMPKDERRNILFDLYQFECNCHACEGDWTATCNSISPNNYPDDFL